VVRRTEHGSHQQGLGSPCLRGHQLQPRGFERSARRTRLRHIQHKCVCAVRELRERRGVELRYLRHPQTIRALCELMRAGAAASGAKESKGDSGPFGVVWLLLSPHTCVVNAVSVTRCAAAAATSTSAAAAAACRQHRKHSIALSD
jgi:hypothetical protein